MESGRSTSGWRAGSQEGAADSYRSKKQQLNLKIKKIKLEIKEYETKRAFRKALYEWKRILALDPAHPEARRMVPQLENGLKMAIDKHLQLAAANFREGNFDRAKKELLMVLFLDPSHQDTLGYLRRISKTSPTDPL